MAWEVRVSAAPDFHRTIFVEIQTSPMSTGRTNFSYISRYISKSPLPHHISQTNRLQQIKKVLEGVWGNLFLKKVPPGKTPSTRTRFLAHFPKKTLTTAASFAKMTIRITVRKF